MLAGMGSLRSQCVAGMGLIRSQCVAGMGQKELG